MILVESNYYDEEQNKNLTELDKVMRIENNNFILNFSLFVTFNIDENNRRRYIQIINIHNPFIYDKRKNYEIKEKVEKWSETKVNNKAKKINKRIWDK